jgi:hypothetical protein
MSAFVPRLGWNIQVQAKQEVAPSEAVSARRLQRGAFSAMPRYALWQSLYPLNRTGHTRQSEKPASGG